MDVQAVAENNVSLPSTISTKILLLVGLWGLFVLWMGCYVIVDGYDLTFPATDEYSPYALFFWQDAWALAAALFLGVLVRNPFAWLNGKRLVFGCIAFAMMLGRCRDTLGSPNDRLLLLAHLARRPAHRIAAVSNQLDGVGVTDDRRLQLDALLAIEAGLVQCLAQIPLGEYPAGSASIRTRTPAPPSMPLPYSSGRSGGAATASTPHEAGRAQGGRQGRRAKAQDRPPGHARA